MIINDIHQKVQWLAGELMKKGIRQSVKNDAERLSLSYTRGYKRCGKASLSFNRSYKSLEKLHRLDFERISIENISNPNESVECRSSKNLLCESGRAIFSILGRYPGEANTQAKISFARGVTQGMGMSSAEVPNQSLRNI